MNATLSPCGEIVRTGDPDRFRSALFAPLDKREYLFALYAFNLEIAKIAPMVSEPMLGEIRLQWWREAIDAAYADGPIREHEVVESLTKLIRERPVFKRSFELMIDARSSELDPTFPSDGDALKTYLRHTGGQIAVTACIALSGVGDKAVEIVDDVGTAIAIARYLKAMPTLMEQGKRTIFHEPYTFDIEKEPVSTGSVRTQTSPNLTKAIRELAAYGLERLTVARAHRFYVDGESFPALLEAKLSERVLKHHVKCPMEWQDSPRSSLRLLWAGVRGRW